MLLIRGQHNLRPEHRGCVATIGNFDGVHLGHQAVFSALAGRAEGKPTTVITFEPQPQEYFRGEQAPARLTRAREKLGAIAAAGVDRVLLLKFDHHLAQRTAGQFVQQVLVDGLGVADLLVGDDFQFGRGREGNFAFLQAEGRRLGFEVENLDTICCAADARVSSTRIRQALAEGDFALARDLLGRPYSMIGRVGHGLKLGRKLGFPTANLEIGRRVSPLMGVFAVKVNGPGLSNHPGVASLGVRPTVANDLRPLLEVYLLDWDGDLYGSRLEVEFIERIREERKFESLDALCEQMAIDVKVGRDILFP